MYHDKINPRDIKVGEQYQYEEKYHFAAVVTVLENLSEEDSKNGNWYEYKIRVDEVIFGSVQVGYEFTCGMRVGFEHYAGWKMKSIGSPTDYVRLSTIRG